jgi:Domain of unknown function (DUF4214)/FG-GAP-like repeat
MHAEKLPRVRLVLESLEGRVNPTPVLLQNVSIPGAYPQQGIYSPAPVTADLDGDGQQEVLVTGGNALYAYKLNNATGQMAIDHAYTQGSPQGPLNSTPIVVNFPSGPEVFLGDGHGTVFGWNARTGNLLPGWPQTVAYYNAALPLPGEIFAANQIYGGLAEGDLDGDGVPEIVATSLNHEVTAFHANGSVMWRFNNDDTIFDSVAIGDLNGDGLPEVVVGGDSSASAVYWTGGRVNCLSWDGRREWVKQTNQVIWSSPDLVDLFGDGKLEIIVGTGYDYPEPIPGHAPFPGNEVIGLDANGNDLPGWPYVTADSSVDARTRSLPAIADLSGDGKLDVTIADAQGQLLALAGSGQKLWSVQASGSADLYPSPIVADVNNDGKPDVILEVPEGQIKAFDGSTGALLWDYTDGLGHLTSPVVGHFRGGVSWQLAMVSQGFDAPSGTLLTPSNLLIFDLGASTLTPPWGQSRQDAQGIAVSRPDSFTTSYVTALFQGTLGRPPSASEMATWLPIYGHAPTLLQPTLQMLDNSATRQTLISGWYQTYLGRAADTDGLAAWTAALGSGQTYTFVEANLAASLEGFSKAGGANAAWVASLYQNVLGRPAGAGEANFWTNTLNANPSGRFQVALAILRSPEATNRVVTEWYATYRPGGLSAPPVDDLEALGWDLRRGRPEDQLLASLLVSRGDYVSTQNEGSWLRALYQDVLQRSAQPSEVTGWLQQMEAGVLAGAVAAAFAKSSEYHRILIGTWIQKLLHRAASSSDLSYFGGLLDQGVASVTVMQTLLASDEYWSTRAGGNVAAYVNQVFLDQVGHAASAAQIAYWSAQPNVRRLLSAMLMTTQEYYLYVIGGDTFSSWEGQFLRRFADTQPDNSRLYPAGTVPDSLGMAIAWAGGARPEDLLAGLLGSAEYMQVARDKAFWNGARWLS